MTPEKVKRKLTAILSADVKGYSRLMGADEVGTIRILQTYRGMISDLIQKKGGRVVDSPGDNVLAEFASVVDALESAVEIQRELKDRNADRSESRRMEFRIGINLGDVIEEGERIYGDGVNIAARIEGLAEGGGICMSGTAFDHIGKRLPLGYEYMGEQVVKNIEKPVRVYRVLMEPEQAGKVIGEKGPRQTQWRWAVAAAVVLVVGALALWNFYFRPSPIEPASKDKMAFALPDEPSIAVLPFVNMSDDPKQEFLSDGITEEITTALSKVRHLFVISRQSTFSYKGKPVKVKQVSEELGVRYVLEGSIQRSGDRIRINAQLIDAVKGRHIWAERYDRELTDIFAMQDDITMKILTAIQVKLTEGEAVSGAEKYFKGKQGLECYLKVMEATKVLAAYNADSARTGRRIAEDALGMCPENSSVYLLMSWVHYLEYWFGLSKSPRESIGKGIELVQKALAIDGSSASAHARLSLFSSIKGEHDKAMSEGERAVALMPGGALTQTNYGMSLLYGGRAEEAIPVFQKAIRLNPFESSCFHNLGHAYRVTGRLEEAVSEYKKALQRASDNLFAHLGLAATYTMMGREQEARAEAAEVLRISPKFSVDSYAKRLTFKDPSLTDKFSDALRKAGLPDKPPLPLPDKPSIAVLPFVNMSDDKSQEFFSDGLTEEIITALSKTPKLFVIARNSSFVYKGKAMNVQQVSRELGVKYVLEGSVRRGGDQLRITAQLIDATTGNHLWAERYDRELKDFFAIQDEVTMKILTSLQVKLTEGESARSFDRGTDSLEAYLKTIEGRELMHAMNKDDNALARKKFEEAIELDPKFARAYAGLSFAYSLDFMFGVDPKGSLRKAHDYAQKAIDLDEKQLLAHGALEFAYIWRRQHDMAIASGERAVQVAPGCADAYFYLGRALAFAGRYQESVSQLEKAIRMNPFPPGLYYMHLGMAQLSLRQYEQAVSTLKKALALNPKNISARRMLTVTYVEMGSLEDAKVQAEEILKIDPRFTSKGFEKIMPFKDGELGIRYMEALRKAGLERDVSGN